jgi:hypothetical protein
MAPRFAATQPASASGRRRMQRPVEAAAQQRRRSRRRTRSSRSTPSTSAWTCSRAHLVLSRLCQSSQADHDGRTAESEARRRPATDCRAIGGVGGRVVVVGGGGGRSLEPPPRHAGEAQRARRRGSDGPTDWQPPEPQRRQQRWRSRRMTHHSLTGAYAIDGKDALTASAAGQHHGSARAPACGCCPRPRTACRQRRTAPS